MLWNILYLKHLLRRNSHIPSLALHLDGLEWNQCARGKAQMQWELHGVVPENGASGASTGPGGGQDPDPEPEFARDFV